MFIFRELAVLGAVLSAMLLAVPAASAQGTPSAAQERTPAPNELDRMVRLLQEVGYRAAPSEGASVPTIETKFSGVATYVQVLNCEDEQQVRGCEVLRFYAGFDKPDGIDMKLVNDWNYEKYFGRAYLDEENDPFIDLVVSMVDASDANIKDVINWWDVVMGQFTDHIDW
jgi:hypothetical protein